MKNIGKKILERRKYLKITQEELSETTGVSVRTIKYIENEEVSPNVSTLTILLESLGLELTIRNRRSNE